MNSNFSTCLGDLPVFKEAVKDMKSEHTLRRCNNPRWEVASKSGNSNWEIEYYYQYKTKIGALIKMLKESIKSDRSKTNIALYKINK